MNHTQHCVKNDRNTPLTHAPSSCGALTHLHLAVGLQQLSDGHFVLLQSPLHQLGVANVDRALHVGRVELGKRPAVDHQQATRAPLDQARQALDVHGASLVGPFLPCHDAAEWQAVRTGWRWGFRGRRTGGGRDGEEERSAEEGYCHKIHGAWREEMKEIKQKQMTREKVNIQNRMLKLLLSSSDIQITTISSEILIKPTDLSSCF